jgi:hypothetical protein
MSIYLLIYYISYLYNVLPDGIIMRHKSIFNCYLLYYYDRTFYSLKYFNFVQLDFLYYEQDNEGGHPG